VATAHCVSVSASDGYHRFALAVLAVFGIQSIRISVKRRSILEITARSQVGHSVNEAENNR
jgi:hypothetical protein